MKIIKVKIASIVHCFLGILICSTTFSQTQLVEDFNSGSASANNFNHFAYNGQFYIYASNGVNGGELFLFDGVNRTLVADLNPGSASSNIASAIEFQNKMYFSANDGNSGAELFSFDGANISLVADINPTGNSSPTNFTIFQNELFFAANDGSNGNELWKYDGTSVSMVMDINAGSSNSHPSNLIVFANTLIFKATDVGTGNELYSYDGIAVTLLADINPSGQSNISNFTILNGVLYFSANDNINGLELWTYDGSSVQLFMDYVPGSLGLSPNYFQLYNNEIYFAGTTAAEGKELFKTDGNTISLVSDINSGTANSNPVEFYLFNGDMFFRADNGVSGFELHKYDGSSVTLVGEVAIGAQSSYSQNIYGFNGYIYFMADDGTLGYELYRTDGNNIDLVQDIWEGSSDSYPGYFFDLNGVLYFDANDGVHGVELHSYDGCSVTKYLTETVCGNVYTVPSGDESYITSGNYLDTIPSSLGCDSILRIHLELTYDFSGPTPMISTLPSVLAQCEVVSLVFPMGIDNCSGSVIGTLTSSLPITQLGSNQVTWQYIDDNGNITLQTQEVIIIDTINPNLNIADITVYLDQNGEHYLVSSDYDLGSNDDCGSYSSALSLDYLDCSNIGTNSISVTITDEANNDSSDVITVNVLDTIAPTPFTLSLGDIVAVQEVNVLYPPLVTDNCGLVTISNDAVLPIQNDTIIVWTYEDQYGNVTTQSQNVDILSPQFAGIENNDEPKFILYPNPASAIFTFEGDLNGEVMIYDQLGRELFRATVYDKLDIDISNFTSGNYLVKYTNETRTGFKKLIVK